MLVLKRNGETVERVQPGGWFRLPDGSSCSPAYAGWSNEDGYLIEEDADPVPPQPTIEAQRAAMVCSRMQGILALGEARWAKILEYQAAVTTKWAEQVIIDDAGDWHRTSQNIQFFGYLLGLDDAEIDDLFRVAMAISA